MASISEIPASPFLGMNAFAQTNEFTRDEGVQIDDSPELRGLVAEASKMKELPFDEKLEAVRKLAKDAMENAWEGYCKSDSNSSRKEFYKRIIFETHPLSEALQRKAGCCRYQAALFLVLSAAANLGDAHYLQSAPISRKISTCFNDVVEKGRVHHVSIFCDSLKDPKLNYSPDGDLFATPHFLKIGSTFLSYKTENDEIVPQSKINHHPRLSDSEAEMYQSWAHDYRGVTGTPLFFELFNVWGRE